MPRLYNSASHAVDFCNECFPNEEEALKEYGDESKTGTGPDGRGNCFSYEEDHPDYDDTDYKCQSCRKKLTSKDN